jgi:hypothetical protein
MQRSASNPFITGMSISMQIRSKGAREVLISILKHLGYCVEVVKNGGQAVKKLQLQLPLTITSSWIARCP